MSQIFTCPDPAHLARLLEGELSEAEQTDLTEHLDGCARCQQAVQELASGGRTWAEVAAYLKHEHARTEKEPALQQAVAELAGPARTDETQTEPGAGNDQALDFLAPSTKPGSLGRLDHYEVLEVIGRGGMGMVLKAFDEALHRVVAVKVLSPSLASSATARRRFGREAKAAAAVSHDHVVTIHAVEGDKPIPYLVMQCVAGFSLEDKLARNGPLGVKEILRIGMQTAEGLAAAHKQGLVHRDIKPANILLENGVERVKITDFGLARAVDDASLTQSGVVAGTPQYMSPEQAQGDAVDPRSDLFSLGSVLYAMCTGRPPFRATGTMAVLKRVCEDTPRPIREINPDIPKWLCDIIAKLHAKKPADRFQSATEVADLLSRHLAHLQQPTLVPAPTPIVHSSGALEPADGESTVRPAVQPVNSSPPIHKKRAVWIIVTAFCIVGLVIIETLNLYALRLFEDGPAWLRDYGPLMCGAVVLAFAALLWLVVFRRSKGQHDPEERAAAHRRRRWAGLIGLTLIGGVGVSGIVLWIAHAFFSTEPKDAPNNDATVIMYWTDPELVVVLNGEGETYVSGVENAVAMGVKPGAYTIRAKKGKDLVYQESFTLAAREGREFYLPPYQAGLGAAGPLRDAVLVMTFEKDTFYEKDGKTYVRDLSGNGNDGVCDNVAFTPDGKAGGGLQCKGAGAVWLNRPLLNGSESFTVTAWVRVVDDGRGDVLGWPIIESTSPNVEDRLFGVRLSRNGLLSVASGNRTYTRADAYTEGKWFFLAVTCEKGEGKERNLQIIVDDAKYPFTLEMADSELPAMAWLGGGMAGTLDEVTVFHHVLSAGELDAIRRQGMKGRPLTTLDDRAKWERSVAAMPAEEQVKALAAKLKELNPGFDSRVTVINRKRVGPGDNGGLQVSDIEHGVVTALWIDTAEVANLAPVRALTGLQHLYLNPENGGKYRDLSPLRGLPLKSLTFHSSLVSDLAPLKDMQLENLYCSGSGISDLSPLKGMPLRFLVIDQTRVRDLSPLRDMPVESLGCRQTHVNDPEVLDQNLDVLRTLPKLWALGIDLTLKNEEALLGFKTLERINGSEVANFWKEVDTLDTWVRKVAALPGDEQVNEVVAKLKILNRGYDGEKTATINNGVVTQFELCTDHVTNIAPLRALTKLQIVGCRGSGPDKGRLSDLAPLKGLSLESLDCKCNPVSDLSPLRHMPLKELHCGVDVSRDAAVLRGIKTLIKINDQTSAEFWTGVTPSIVEAADHLAAAWRIADDIKLTVPEAEFKKAVDVRPDDPQVWKWRGVILLEGDRDGGAARDFNKALELTASERRSSWSRASEIDDLLCRRDQLFYEIERLRPKDVHLWIARAKWFAHRGKWKEAADLSARVVQRTPDDAENWFMDQPLWLQIGAVEGYRRDCREMLKRFGKSDNPQRDDQVAKTCLLAPLAVDDLDPVGLLAGNSHAVPAKDGPSLWYVVCRSLFEYRTRKWDDCIQRARAVVDAKPEHAARDATLLVIIAMAEQKRGKSDEARAALKDARARIEANMPKVERGQLFGDDWHDWLRCQILLREAEELLQPPPPPLPGL
jgi:serine/threonine protein kinase